MSLNNLLLKKKKCISISEVPKQKLKYKLIVLFDHMTKDGLNQNKALYF